VDVVDPLADACDDRTHRNGGRSVLRENAPTRHASEQMPFAPAQADARRRSRSKNVDRLVTAGDQRAVLRQ
jgi:hypothetical protein